VNPTVFAFRQLPRVPRAALLTGLLVLASPRLAPAQAAHDTLLTLGEAARLAARESAPAQAARARVEAAGARVTQSRAALLPGASIVASQRQRTFNTAEMGIDFPSAPGQPPVFDPNGEVLGPVNVYDVRGRVTQSLYDRAAVQRVRAARAAQQATSQEAASSSQGAAAMAATAYVRAQRADAQLEARIADSTLAADLLTIAREQLRAGIGVALDVTRAESQLAAARAALIVSRNERDRAALELSRTLGLPLDAHVRLADCLDAAAEDAPVPSEEEALQVAYASRADLRAVAAQVEAVRRQVSAINAERLPTVGAFVDHGAIGKSVEHLKGTYAWGIQASVPIFEGFRREGRAQEQEALRRELEIHERDLRAQTAVEVRGALLDLRASREQTAAARERVRLAELEVRQARDRFRAGVSGNADVITASLTLNAARTAYVDALASARLATVALARAEGVIEALP